MASPQLGIVRGVTTPGVVHGAAVADPTRWHPSSPPPRAGPTPRSPVRRGKEFPADPPPSRFLLCSPHRLLQCPGTAPGPVVPGGAPWCHLHHAVPPPPPRGPGRPRRCGLAARATAPAAGGAGQARWGPAATGGQNDARRRGDRLR